MGGFLLNDHNLTVDEFLNPKRNYHPITTRWIHHTNSRPDERIENYPDDTVAPTSVLMWFLRRTHQNKWLNPLCLTGFHYQNFLQYSAFIKCDFDFYRKPRFHM